jgi:hypothetical protein
MLIIWRSEDLSIPGSAHFGTPGGPSGTLNRRVVFELKRTEFASIQGRVVFDLMRVEKAVHHGRVSTDFS